MSDGDVTKKTKKMDLTMRIFYGMLLGIVLGVVWNLVGVAELQPVLDEFFIHGVLVVVGKIFIAGLKLSIVPLVFVSLVYGVSSLSDTARLGVMGIKTLALYLLTTAGAVTLALVAATFVNPGEGHELVEGVAYQAPQAKSLQDVIINIFPTNPVQAMAEGNMLQVIVFSILFGLAIIALGRSKRERFRELFKDLNDVVLKLVWIILKLAPYGVFALIARTFAMEGISAIQDLAWYFGTVLGVLFIHALVVYPILFKLFTGLSPLKFLRKMREVWAFAFSTASSSATLPITLKTVSQRLGVSNGVSSFVVPLGATINMDGTAIMQGVATVFIAQISGVDLSSGQLLTVVLTATLASIGTAGVPGAGLIMLTIVLEQVGLPIEAIAMIIGVDRLLDMVRTAVNVTGDALISCVVAKGEGELDSTLFNRPLAQIEATEDL